MARTGDATPRTGGPPRLALRPRSSDERGYAMAALLVGMSVMAIVMSAALPVWSTAAKRVKEDELVFRGEQYARAIMLFQRKYANALPPSVDLLVNERFLRRKYLDPMTGGEFQILTGALGQATPGAPGLGASRPGGAAPASPTTSAGRGSANPASGAGRAGQPGVGGGGITGVASKSTERSLRLYNGRGAYNEWTFVPVQRQQQAGGPPGADAPGRGGADGRGGRAGQPPTGSGGLRPAGGSRGFRPDVRSSGP